MLHDNISLECGTTTQLLELAYKLIPHLKLCTCNLFTYFRWTCCYPKWDLFNANRELILTIGGPLCQCKCCGDVVYNVGIFIFPWCLVFIKLVYCGNGITICNKEAGKNLYLYAI